MKTKSSSGHKTKTYIVNSALRRGTSKNARACCLESLNCLIKTGWNGNMWFCLKVDFYSMMRIKKRQIGVESVPHKQATQLTSDRRKSSLRDLFRRNRFLLHLRCGQRNLQGNLATQGFQTHRACRWVRSHNHRLSRWFSLFQWKSEDCGPPTPSMGLSTSWSKPHSLLFFFIRHQSNNDFANFLTNSMWHFYATQKYYT